jgi:2-C-methyl-D-erythritol 4-phosphate cytidylyltransferase
MVIAAVLGGGKGSRMGTDVPKQFLPLGGVPVFLHSLKAFLAHPRVDAALLLVPEEYLSRAEALVKEAFPAETKPVSVLAGGETRTDTLLLALEHIRAAYGLAGNVILTHDAARPFVTACMIDDNIDAALAYGAVNTCVPATDTVFLSEDGAFLSAVPPRSTVFHAQTPQSFRAEELYELLSRVPAQERAALTDGCSVFTRFGRPVRMVPGDETNLKITYPGDLKRAEQILAEREEFGVGS